MGLETGENLPEGKKETSVTELVELLKKQQAEIDNLKKQNLGSGSGFDIDGIAKIIKATKESEKDIDYASGITTDQVPEDDYDENGVMFSAPFLGYEIVDDIRKGHRVRLPYGKKDIFFEYGATRRYMQGNGYEAIVPYSTYLSRSKKEIEWLKNHSMFNVQFYESLNETAHVDGERINRLSVIMKMLNTLEVVDLIKRGKDYGVPYSSDPKTMRINIAMKMIDKEFEHLKQKTTDRLIETEKEKLILKA